MMVCVVDILLKKLQAGKSYKQVLYGLVFIEMSNIDARLAKHVSKQWAEADSVARITAAVVSKFVLDYIYSRFGTPLEILSDRGPGFRADLLDALLENLSIKHVHSTPYYPQCNGLVEKTNGVLCKIITKHVRDRPQDWDKHLTAALWAYRTSFKVSTQFTPYHLVYGQEAFLPIEVELGSLRVLARETTSSKEKLEQRILDLQRLELDREAATDYYITQANKKREQFNNKVKEKKLEEGMLVMRMKNQATKEPSDSERGTPRKGKSSMQESPNQNRQAKEEFLKKRAFGSMGTFGMSNVSSTTFSASTADVAAISNMKANAAEKLKEKQQCLKAIKIALDQSKTKRDEQVGLMRGAAKIIEKLNKDMEELKLHKAGLVPNEEEMAKLETLIQIRKEALKDMGLDIEVHNLDNLGEETAQLQVPLKDALKLLAPREANMDEHVDTEKDPMEGIFESLVDGIAHSQAGSSPKPNIHSMCGGCGDKNASQKQAGDASKESVKVPLKPKPAMNRDVEDTEKSSEKPIEKDTIVNLSDEDADLLISDVCGEILGRRKKRSNTEEHATPKKKAKVASKPPEPTPGVSPAKWTVVAIEVQEINEMEINSLEELSWIGDVQEPDETVEDMAAKQDAEQDADQDADVTPDKVEEDQEPAVCPKIEEILPNCLGWGYLVLNFARPKSSSSLISMDYL
ncbi:hypothetical protein L7F22_033499 [Adiantum nelumboides]|nr:hypothetical protein [Adiantum nelumboides]